MIIISGKNIKFIKEKYGEENMGATLAIPRGFLLSKGQQAVLLLNKEKLVVVYISKVGLDVKLVESYQRKDIDFELDSFFILTKRLIIYSGNERFVFHINSSIHKDVKELHNAFIDKL